MGKSDGRENQLGRNIRFYCIKLYFRLCYINNGG